MKVYTGIGSRRVREDPAMFARMVTLGKLAAENGWTLRSGAADGADSAFEQGCDQANGSKEIFLPWKGFNKHVSPLYTQPDDAFVIASATHPAYNRLPPTVRKLMARNTQQILGEKLDTPTSFVVCWTPDGAESIEDYDEETGGTGMAIALASCLNIPILNLCHPERYEEVVSLLTNPNFVV